MIMSATISHPGVRVDRTVPGFPVEPASDCFEPATIRPPQFAVATVAPEDSASRATSVATPAWYVPVKRCFDFVAALVLLVVAAPILVAGALLVKLTSRGPAFYRQVRLGLDGRPFTLLKLRTMRHNAEAETGPVWSTANDPRITPLGDLLRRTHIDEFPQLLNVALGQMSLVGPRPERPEFVARLDYEVPGYRERLKVRPGITGLAQMRLPADSTIECVRRKVVHDIYYVQHASPWLDFKLLCMTAWRLVSEIASFCSKFIAVPTSKEIERGYRRAMNIATSETAPAAPPVALASIAKVTAAAETVPDMVAFWDVE
jgi:lipopolysaccharide/colanic/teichoic acid biosynthesis glycosyltransferase